MSDDYWHDWHGELNRATEIYNTLLRRLATERRACISIELERQTTPNGIGYNVLEWYCYASPAACTDCGQSAGNYIHRVSNQRKGAGE